MPWDEGMAQLIRDDLAGEPMQEKKMFGGLAFMRQGNMVAGIHKGGVFLRVGKPNEAAALALAGVTPMAMAGRAMPGMVALDDDLVADDARRAAALSLALGFARGLPPKQAKG